MYREGCLIIRVDVYHLQVTIDPNYSIIKTEFVLLRILGLQCEKYFKYVCQQNATILKLSLFPRGIRETHFFQRTLYVLKQN